MNSQTRRKRRILRSARRGPWGKGIRAVSNSMQPVYAADGSILHYKLVNDPWFTRRRGWYRFGSWIPTFPNHYLTGGHGGPKSRQQWLKETEKAARCTIDHVLSDCCGWGNEEPYHDPYQFLGSITPARNRPYQPEEDA